MSRLILACLTIVLAIALPSSATARTRDYGSADLQQMSVVDRVRTIEQSVTEGGKAAGGSSSFFEGCYGRVEAS